jgi:dienelactone hydrolase
MASHIDFGRLRELVDSVAGMIAHAGTQAVLPDGFVRVGLPVPTEDGTKSERAQRSVAAVPDERLPEVARHMLCRRRR